MRIKQSLENDAIDSKYGFERVKDYQERTGFLINMHSVSLITVVHFFQYQYIDWFLKLCELQIAKAALNATNCQIYLFESELILYK